MQVLGPSAVGGVALTLPLSTKDFNLLDVFWWSATILSANGFVSLSGSFEEGKLAGLNLEHIADRNLIHELLRRCRLLRLTGPRRRGTWFGSGLTGQAVFV